MLSPESSPGGGKRSGSVGAVFTPLRWARWLIERYGILQRWVEGAVICDPTAGEGSFALALFEAAAERQIPLTAEMLKNLYLVEIKPDFLKTFAEKARDEYRIDFPESNLLAGDVILDTPEINADILIGNPPWMNFTGLPGEYKEKLKPIFIRAGLAPRSRDLLLGASRVDIAALVLKTVFEKMAAPNGTGYFYLPLSLFCGDKAHDGFRNYRAGERDFRVDEVYEFPGDLIFKSVKTFYCAASFQVDEKQTFPVKYTRLAGGKEEKLYAAPFGHSCGQWRITPSPVPQKTGKIRLELREEQKPREGVNSCGANEVFVFREYPDFLPENLVYPLITGRFWRNPDMSPEKWVFLPYSPETGRVLEWNALPQSARDYLLKHKEKLEARKGSMLNVFLKKGIWWALLGVGPYSFMPYKIVWQAYGKKEFTPLIFHEHQGKLWQADQAMQAYIPCRTSDEALHITMKLASMDIAAVLRETNSQGRCNWAQPGKIHRILKELG